MCIYIYIHTTTVVIIIMIMTVVVLAARAARNIITVIPLSWMYKPTRSDSYPNPLRLTECY